MSVLRGPRAARPGGRLCVAVAVLVLTGALPAAAQAPPSDPASGALLGELGRLRFEVAALVLALRQRDDALESMQREIKGLAEDVGAVKERTAALAAQPVLAAAFLANPPAGSDSLGVARAPVFAPRLNVDSVRRHDTLFLKLRRIEPAGIKLVAELELPASEPEVDLPLDRNGALYVLEWSTSEGFSYTLAVRDGASEQTAASIQVRPLLNRGRFLFVGSRLE